MSISNFHLDDKKLEQLRLAREKALNNRKRKSEEKNKQLYLELKKQFEGEDKPVNVVEPVNEPEPVKETIEPVKQKEVVVKPVKQKEKEIIITNPVNNTSDVLLSKVKKYYKTKYQLKKLKKKQKEEESEDSDDEESEEEPTQRVQPVQQQHPQLEYFKQLSSLLR